MKICSRLSVVLVEILRKTTNLGISAPFGEVRGDARHWLMARCKAHGQLSILIN